ncbi:MAG: hypothetical protein IPN14_10520 [Bacteroidetes bacterium]|nr:hypothetical protein [Bacteroidota bacterium]
MAESFHGSNGENASGIIVNNQEQVIISFGAASVDGDFTLHTLADGQSAAILKCIDTLQNLVWEKKYGGSKGEQGYVLLQDTLSSDIFFIGAGWSKDGDMWDTSANLANINIAATPLSWVMRLDSLGSKKWSHVYGPLGNNPSEHANCHIQENRGGATLKDGKLWILNEVSGRDDNIIGESMGGGNKTDAWFLQWI